MKVLWTTLALIVLAGNAAAQSRSDEPVVSFRVEIAGQAATSVRQLSVSAGMPTLGETSYDPITLSLTADLGAADPVLDAWYGRGAEADKRDINVRLVTLRGESGGYAFTGCQITNRSFQLPGYSVQQQDESWTVTCASMSRR